jgi:hypothetical protein
MRDNSQRSTLLVYFFAILIFSYLLSIYTGYLHYDMLIHARDEGGVTNEVFESDEARFGIGLIIKYVVLFMVSVLFLLWFRRGYGNLHALNIKSLNYSASMSIWGFFIPFVNLIRPYEIAKDMAIEIRVMIGKVSKDYQHKTNDSVVAWWWGTYVITSIVMTIVGRLVEDAETLDGMINFAMVDIINNIVHIPAAIMALIMVRQISQDENTLLQLYASGQLEAVNSTNSRIDAGLN